MAANRPLGIGLRAQKGGALVVAVEMEAGEPRILLSTAIETHEAGDRLSLEPYRVAAEVAAGVRCGVPAEAAAAVAEGRKRQERMAAEALRDVIHRLGAAGNEPIIAALLVNRAGWIADLLSYSLAWAAHVPVAELLAVRDALRSAFSQCGVEGVELDEKSLFDLAAERLDLSPEEIESRLKALGASAGKPWRKEQRLACLAAWVAVSGPR
ncbi:MAG TPA: hypothetical protein VFW19_12280 [Allosphingosinicella sp.]|nr:hypothetical protein [Allosphingosinicella sp.]